MKNTENIEKGLKTISIILIVIAALLALNTCALLFNSKSNANNTQTLSEENEEYDVNMFTKINETNFLKTVKKTDSQVIYLGRATCGYCVKFLPTLQKAQQELKYKTNYVDITALDETSDDYTSMVKMINDMTETFNKKHDLTGDSAYKYLYGYTPMVLISKNNKIVDVWVGYSEYETFVEWLNENGIK